VRRHTWQGLSGIFGVIRAIVVPPTAARRCVPGHRPLKWLA
jgi:hypothetical protein